MSQTKASCPEKQILIIFLLSAILIGFSLIYVFDISTVSAQSLNQNEVNSSGVLSNVTLTPDSSSNPASTPTPVSTPASTPTQTPDKYFSSYFAHSWDIPEEVNGGNNFWIEVDLSNQILYAYRGDQFLNAFLISSGTSAFPTVTGAYKIYAKHSQYTMRSPEYDLPDVPYSMFFHKGYSIHGTYWHNNFGTPMSHGCVNMNTDDAAWIYENAPVGTYVFIHY